MAVWLLVRWLSKDERGFGLLDALIAIGIMALLVPAIVTMVMLISASDEQARRELQAYLVAQEQLEWLRANCSQRLDVLLRVTTAPGDPCWEYPRGEEQAVDDDMTYEAEVESINQDLVRVTITVRWTSPIGRHSRSQRQYYGYLYGRRSDYWGP